MKKHNRNIVQVAGMFILAGIVILGVTGCKDNSTAPESEEVYHVQIASSQTHGKIMTDGDGNTLYFFAADVKGESKCNGSCISSWPALDAEEVEVGAGINAEDFGHITCSDGSVQTTYKGWPLYYYADDSQAEDVNGDGVGGVWFVASPDYSLMIASEQLTCNDGKNYIVDADGNYTEGEGSTIYFTDADGRTLHAFAHDMTNTNNYTKSDFSNNGAWPIYYVDIENLPSGMSAQDFGEIDVYGRQQLTKGVSVPSPGVWPTLNGNTSQAPS